MSSDTSIPVRIEYLIRTINQIKKIGQEPSDHLVGLLKELQTLNTKNNEHANIESATTQDPG